MKSILLSLFLCATASAQWDTNAWSGAYWRVLPDGSPTLPQLIDDAVNATKERGEIAIHNEYGGGGEGIILPFPYDLIIDRHRPMLPFDSGWQFRIPSSPNETNLVNALVEIKDFIKAYIPYTYHVTTNNTIADNGVLDICNRLSIPTNYFEYTPPRYLDVPEAYMGSFPTNANTVATFTMADYGWHYIDDILLEMRYFGSVFNEGGYGPNPTEIPIIESTRYDIDAIFTADNSSNYVNVVEATEDTCRMDAGNNGSPITFSNLRYSFVTNNVVTNTSLKVYSLTGAIGSSDLDSLSYTLNQGESLAKDTLTTSFTSPATNTIATLTDNYTLTATNDTYLINYNALFFVKYQAISPTDDTWDMGDFSTLELSADPTGECGGLHSVSFDDLTVTNSYTTLPFFSEITTNSTFQLIGSNVWDAGVTTEIVVTNSFGAYNPKAFVQSDTLENETGTYSGATFTNSFNNSYFYDEIEIPDGASGNKSKSISDRLIILDFFTQGGFDYQ